MIFNESVVGVVEPALGAHLTKDFPTIFACRQNTTRQALKIGTYGLTEEKLCNVSLALHSRYNMTPPIRNELLPVHPLINVRHALSTETLASQLFRNHKLFSIDRISTSSLGIAVFGVMMNCFCFVRGELHLWIGIRSRSRPSSQYPGKIDVMVGGAIASGELPRRTLIREASEECGMPLPIVSRAQFSGFVSYLMCQYGGVKNQVLYTYDLHLGDNEFVNWQPFSLDGSVESFELMPAKEAVRVLKHTDNFKGGADLVTIDFLVRQGVIDDRDGYISNALRQGLLVNGQSMELYRTYW